MAKITFSGWLPSIVSGFVQEPVSRIKLVLSSILFIMIYATINYYFLPNVEYLGDILIIATLIAELSCILIASNGASAMD